MLLASCSADEPVAQNTTEGVINYAVVADNQTRASHSYCPNILPDEFYVWATHTDNDNNQPAKLYINKDHIQRSGDGDSYTDVDGTRYWPQSGTLSFYAVVDGDDKVQYNSSGNIVVEDYEIKNDVTEQLDLMYAVTTDVSNTKDKVSLNFRHALSQICFKAENENPNVRITINSITVGNVYNKGTYTLLAESTTDNINAHNNNYPNALKRGKWSECSKGANNTYFISSMSNNQLDGIKEVDLTYDNNKQHTTNWYSNALNLLPQVYPEDQNQSVDKPYFMLNLTIENRVQESNGGDYTYTPTLESGENFIICPKKINWEQGYRYIYTFKFSQNWESDRAIQYKVTADDFQEGEPLSIDVEGHKAVLMRAAGDGEPALYFATTNIGATTPTDAGKYFWWGDIIGYCAVNNNGSITAQANNGTEFNFIGTNADITTNKDNVDNYLNNSNLNDEHDAARQQWGDLWRMPTKEELQWLVANCDWKAELNSEEDLVGYTVTSKTTQGEIFLPAASCFENKFEGSNNQYKNMCFYWSATISTEKRESQRTAFRLRAEKENKIVVANYGYRWNGFPIRPVISLENSTDAGGSGDADAK